MSTLKYTEDHEWLRLDGDIATVGITDYAQNALGDIVFVQLPEVGARFAAQLAERYGRAWYRQPECGEFLRQLFNRGLTSLEDLKLP